MTPVQSPLASPPLIAYCALHKAAPGVPRESYVSTMQELHNRIAEKTVKLRNEIEESMKNARRNEIHVLRRTLRPTPDEQILGESFDRYSEATTGKRIVGLLGSSEGEVLAEESAGPEAAEMLAKGRAYLSKLGFRAQKEGGGLFESVFLVKGAENLDVLEQIVRDRLGIYGTTHGKHIREFAEYCYYLHNRVFEKGISLSKSVTGMTEAVIFFSKPHLDEIKYAPFRKGVESLAGVLDREVGGMNITVWQRKLGLGAGAEFALRLVCQSPKTVDEAIGCLRADPDRIAQEVLLEKGSMVLKRMLYANGNMSGNVR